MNKIILLAFFIISVSIQSAFANNEKHLLTGRVVDQETNEPIKNVELFISGATIGTTTNENGEFSLNTPFLPCHLVVMHVSYNSVVLPVTKSDNFSIQLRKALLGIDEVKVKGKNMRKRNLRMFYEYFLWNTDKRQIQVLNDSVLKFKRNKHDFHAYCNSPLIIRNNQLGYNVKMLIQDFNVCKKEVKTGRKLELNSNGHGVFKLKAYHYYIETGQSNSEVRNKIEINRRNHYYGSLRHLLTSLYHGNLKKNGFSIKTKGDSIRYPFVLTLAKKGIKRYKFNTDKISVIYHYDYDDKPININHVFTLFKYRTSEFISLGKEFEVRENGTSPNLQFEVKGAMGNNCPANTLPDDYSPK